MTIIRTIRHYHAPKEPKEADSEYEQDAICFNPLNDETKYSLDKSKAKYAKEYCKLHLKEEKIRSSIIEEAPIPGNNVLNPPEIDDYNEDLCNKWQITSL